MKKIWTVILVGLLVLALTACGAKEIEVGTFSYTEVYERNKDALILDGFVNTEPQSIESPEQIVELAKAECFGGVDKQDVDVDYDEEAKKWLVEFYYDYEKHPNMVGGGFVVCLDENGVTDFMVVLD